METEHLEFSDEILMEGEHIEAALNWNGDSGDRVKDDVDVLLLTDRRVVLVNRDGRRRNAIFVAVEDVDSAEVSSESGGYGGYVWGGLAFFVGFMLWRMWDHPIGSVLGPVAVALIGLYLIADQLLSPKTQRATFRAGSSQIHCSINDSGPTADAYAFVNRLFELKAAAGRDRTGGGRPFAPR